MGLSLLPQSIHDRYQIEERRHACAILPEDFPDEFADLVASLDQFELVRSEIMVGGGRKSKITDRLDDFLIARGWSEKSTNIEMTVDGVPRQFETHKVDLCKGQIAIELSGTIKTRFSHVT
jgi:hypothetical protein